MASILLYKNKWRVEIKKRDFYRCRRFSDRAEGEKWGEKIEAEYKLLRSQVKSGLLAGPTTKLKNVLEILDLAQPVAQLCGIYFLIRDDQVIYIGKSKDVYSRIAEHRTRGREFTKFSVVPCDLAHLAGIEAAYIKLFKPIGNRTHTGKKSRTGMPRKELARLVRDAKLATSNFRQP